MRDPAEIHRGSPAGAVREFGGYQQILDDIREPAAVRDDLTRLGGESGHAGLARGAFEHLGAGVQQRERGP